MRLTSAGIFEALVSVMRLAAWVGAMMGTVAAFAFGSPAHLLYAAFGLVAAWYGGTLITRERERQEAPSRELVTANTAA